MNWQSLLKKEISAPWVPELTDALDTSNFEHYDEEDIDPIEPYDGDQEWCRDF